MLCFSMLEGDVPRITVIYLDNGGEEEEEEDLYESAVISKRDATLPMLRMNTSDKSSLQVTPSSGCHMSPV